MTDVGEGFVARGGILLSMPQMLDPNFMHAVVLMIEHTEAGGYGIVINRPLGLDLSALLPDPEPLRGRDLPVHNGGPVGEDQLQFLHRVPALIPDGLPISGDLHFGGDAEAMVAAVGDGRVTPDELRLYVGYAGWGAGQLEDELGVGSWVPAPASTDLVFDPREEESLWRHALRGLGPGGEELSQLPPDPTWN